MQERELCSECGLGYHADYPHEPGTLYGCYHCETNHHETAGVGCVCDGCVGFDYV